MGDLTSTYTPLNYLDKPQNIGLIVLNQELTWPTSLVEQLWHNARIKGVADGGIDRIHRIKPNWELLPDYVSGDFDSANPELLESYKNKGVEIIHTPDQNKTDFQKCLEIMAERSQGLDCIVVLAGLGGRFDHEMANVNIILKKIVDIPVYLHNCGSLTFALEVGKNRLNLTTKFRGDWCGLIPVEPTVVSTSGLKWNLNGEVLEFGGLVSTSNKVLTPECVEIVTNRRMIFTMGVEELVGS